MTDDPVRHLARGEKIPIDDVGDASYRASDWAEYAARGVLSEVRGRRGLGHELVCMDDADKKTMIGNLTLIIRQAHADRGSERGS